MKKLLFTLFAPLLLGVVQAQVIPLPPPTEITEEEGGIDFAKPENFIPLIGKVTWDEFSQMGEPNFRCTQIKETKSQTTANISLVFR